LLDLKSFANAFMTERKDTPLHRSHPLLKLIGTVLLFFVIALSNDLGLIITALIYITLECFVGRIIRNITSFIYSMRWFIFTISLLLFILYEPLRAIIILAKIFAGTITIFAFILSTNYTDLMYSLEKIRVPQGILLPTQLALRTIPLLSKDALEASEALVLRKELRPSIFPRGITSLLALVVSMAILRAECLGEALAAKYYGVAKKRTYLRRPKVTAYSIIQLAIKLILLIIAIVGIEVVDYIYLIIDKIKDMQLFFKFG